MKIIRRLLLGVLPPRVRNTLFAVLAVILSVALIVIVFYLTSKEEQIPIQGEFRQEKALLTDRVFKSGSGKVIRYQEKKWDETNPFQETIIDGEPNPVMIEELNGKLLEKAGPGVTIHPVLGVPVSADFFKADVARIKQIRRIKSRPPNETDIRATLELVQKNAESSRKRLSRKELRLWTAGDQPLLVLLVSTWRSGSTFLGQALANHPGVFQHYEPLSHLGLKQVRSGRLAFQAQQVLHRLVDCQYKTLRDYLNYSKTYPEDMIGHNAPVWNACKKGPNVNSCFNSTFLSESCKMYPVQLIKTVRLRLNLTQLFLNDGKMNSKVVFLIRDPRGTMNSRYSSVSWCSGNPDCDNPEILCSDLEGDLKVAAAFKKLYPGRFTMVKYEDIALDPQNEVRKLMDFLTLEYSQDIDAYVRNHTQSNVDAPWSVQRKSSERINLWKKQLPLEEIHAIQNVCGPVIRSMNYEFMD